ncbi:hypothetical protein O6H91_01G049100 [Diphasiastrum complanatum]|uniref:Uncharacterized protein n=1 Tax=Diphasiastrum complanatum TaxID=34168 RepID=A0ACC2EQR2_DIPCM|nr:hypothetical protein O6H91_01G049100 [Diphasiastrum complanatum]
MAAAVIHRPMAALNPNAKEFIPLAKYVSSDYQTIINDLQLSLLAAEFPKFAVKSMAELLYANDGDLMLTRHMLKEEEAIPWLQTGDAVASLYADMRKEAEDHALARDAYFEQARQAMANDVGNKVLAHQLIAKGSWHNEQMKDAHTKAAEAIFQQRNPPASRQRHPTLLDLHGLHVNEAILIVKRELAALKTKYSKSKRKQIFLCVGTGHHSRSGHPRLPSAIARYLLEEEHLYFTEARPGRQSKEIKTPL